MARVNAQFVEACVADRAGEAGLVLVHLVARDLEDLGVGVEETALAPSGADRVHHLKVGVPFSPLSIVFDCHFITLLGTQLEFLTLSRRCPIHATFSVIRGTSKNESGRRRDGPNDFTIVTQT